MYNAKRFHLIFANLIPQNRLMKELPQRFVTALLVGIVIIGGTLISKYTFGIIFLAISIISSIEYIKITKLRQISLSKRWILIIVNSLVFLLGYGIAIDVLPTRYRILGVLPIFFLFSAGLFGKSSPDYKLSSILISGHAYIGLPLMVLPYVYLHNNDFWPSYVIGILCCVWGNDVGAYLIGKSIGKRKLLPKVSPNKTWEGFIGGLVVAMFVGFVFSLVSENLNTLQWILFGLFTGFGSAFGDLISSSLKRTFGVKDSGNMLPGHGGFIDRFDGFFIGIVFAFAYLSLLGVIY